MKYLVTVQDWLEPSQFHWPDPDGPWLVSITWREHEGHAIATGLSLELLPDQEPQPVTATLMRSLPVARLISTARADRYEGAGAGIVLAHDSGYPIGGVSEGYIEELRAQSQPWVDRGPGRPVELGADHYRAVADVYSDAVTLGRPPLVAVTERWTVSRPTASRWVKAARDAKFLPETDRGRARGNGTLTNRKGASR